MSSGVQMNAIGIQLARLEKNIVKESLQLIGSGVRPAIDDPGYQSFFQKLEQWSIQLEAIRQRLRSAEHGLAMERQQAKSASRDQRFRAQQSVTDRNKRLQGIQTDANRATAYLVKLYQLALTPTSADVQKGMFQILEGALDAGKSFAELEKLSLIQPSANATAAVMRVQQGLQMPRHEAPDPLAVLTLVLQLLRIWWLEKLRQKNK